MTATVQVQPPPTRVKEELEIFDLDGWVKPRSGEEQLRLFCRAFAITAVTAIYFGFEVAALDQDIRHRLEEKRRRYPFTPREKLQRLVVDALWGCGNFFWGASVFLGFFLAKIFDNFEDVLISAEETEGSLREIFTGEFPSPDDRGDRND